MLARLKRAGRSCVALIWAMAALFALAPAVSMAFAAPVGAFSRVLLHVHGHDEQAMCIMDITITQISTRRSSPRRRRTDDGPDHDDQGQHRLHVHHDACCPSVLMPSQSGETRADIALAGPDHHPPVEPMQGAPPDRLLRPPIPPS